MKQYLTITHEEYFSLLQSRCNGDLSALTPEIIMETVRPFICYGFDLPEEIKIEQDIEQEFKTLSGDPLANMKKYLEDVEKINIIFKQYSPCKKGCSKCCFIPVLVSSLEVSLIEEYLNSIHNNFYYKRKEKNDNNLLTRDKGKIIGEEYNGVKCPFLRKNECFIYNVRPYVCRRYITFEDSNKKCGHKEAHISLFKSFVIENAYENIIKYYLVKNPISDSNNIIFGDIRDFFNESF